MCFGNSSECLRNSWQTVEMRRGEQERIIVAYRLSYHRAIQTSQTHVFTLLTSQFMKHVTRTNKQLILGKCEHMNWTFPVRHLRYSIWLAIMTVFPQKNRIDWEIKAQSPSSLKAPDVDQSRENGQELWLWRQIDLPYSDVSQQIFLEPPQTSFETRGLHGIFKWKWKTFIILALCLHAGAKLVDSVNLKFCVFTWNIVQTWPYCGFL